MAGAIIAGPLQVEGNLNVWTSSVITSSGIVSATEFRDYTFSGSKILVSDASKSVAESSVASSQVTYLTNVSADIQTQISNIYSAVTVNVISVATNTQLNSTGRHLSATIPSNTISETIPTQVKIIGNLGVNYVGGTATIEIYLGSENVFTHTLSATGQNEDELFEIDFGIRYAGSSTMEVVGLCKIDNIVTTTQTPKVRRVSHFFIGVPSTAYVFDVKSTVSGTAGASVTLVKVTRG